MAPKSSAVLTADSLQKHGEPYFEALLECLGEGVLVCNREDVILHVNSRTSELFGYAREEMIGRRAPELFLSPGERHVLMEKTRMRLTGVSERYEIQLQRKDGSRFWAEIHGTPLISDDGDIIGTVGAIADVSARRTAADTLRQQRAFLESILDANPNFICVKDIDGRYKLANRAFADFLGVSRPEDLVGKTAASVYPYQEDLRRYLADDREVIVKNKEISHSEVAIKDPRTGEVRWCQVTKRPIELPSGATTERHVLAIMTDITGRKTAEQDNFRLQSQLFHSQKMEAIGQLAAGVAHDLNNALGAVVGHLQLLQHIGYPDPEMQRSIGIALQGCERACSLISRLLTFSKQRMATTEEIDLGKFIVETVSFLSQVVPKNIEIRLPPVHSPEVIRGDPAQLQQAITNLVINATQAMPNGGMISFAVEHHRIKNPSPFNRGAHPGAYTVLRVKDSGVGIPGEILHKIFEPFFSTRQQGGGTGLGLAMVYAALQDHGGWIDVSSTPGHGAEFSLFFPSVKHASVSPAEHDSVHEQTAGEGRIMVIDDEEWLVDLAQQFFSHAGFSIRGFTDASKGLEWYRSNSRDVDLTILDMKMPVMDGEVCFDKIREINPQAKVIVLSGYLQDPSTQSLMKKGALRIFQKPLKYPDLVAWVTEQLVRKQ